MTKIIFSKFSLLLVICSAISFSLLGQGTTCGSSEVLCDPNTSFPLGTGGADLGAIDCLGDSPSPNFYTLTISQSGDLDINILAEGPDPTTTDDDADVDFAIWGPFTSPTGNCAGNLPTGPIPDCSYSAASSEDVQVPGVVAGEVYILMITNYLDDANNNVTLSPNGGNTAALGAPLINFTGTTNFADTDAAVNLTTDPANGSTGTSFTCSGPGITDGANCTFDPAVAGVGCHDITLVGTAFSCPVNQTTAMAICVCPDLTAAAPAAVISSESTCSTPGGTPGSDGGGVIAAPATACPTGSTLEYSTDGGTTWSTTLPAYDQTNSITVETRCLCDFDDTQVSPTSSITTTPGPCSACPDLTAAAPAAVISSESTCSTPGGTTGSDGGGVIAAPATACPTLSTLQYSTDGGTTWSTTLPAYDQANSITVETRCLCDNDMTMSSPTSSITTTPGTCPPVPTFTFGFFDPCSCRADGNFDEVFGVSGPAGFDVYVTSIVGDVNGLVGPLPLQLAYDAGAGGYASPTFQHADNAGYTANYEIYNAGGTPGVDAPIANGSGSNKCAYPVVDFTPMGGNYNVSDPAVTLTGSSTPSLTNEMFLFAGTGVAGTTFTPATAGSGTHTVTMTYTADDDGNAGVSPNGGVDPAYPAITAGCLEVMYDFIICGADNGTLTITGSN